MQGYAPRNARHLWGYNRANNSVDPDHDRLVEAT